MSTKQLSLNIGSDDSQAESPSNDSRKNMSKLTPKDNLRLLLQLLSVIYEPVTITPLLRCVKALNWTQDSGIQHTNKSLKLLLGELKRKKRIDESGSSYSCKLFIIEEISRQAVDEDVFNDMAKAVQECIPLYSGWNELVPKNWEQAVREVRIGAYQGSERKTVLAVRNCKAHFPYNEVDEIFYRIFFEKFDANLLSRLPEKLLTSVFVAAANSASSNYSNNDEAIEWLLNKHRSKKDSLPIGLVYFLSTALLLKGDIAKVEEIPLDTNEYFHFMLGGWGSFLKGNNENAIDLFELSLKALRKTTKKRKIFIDGLPGMFFILALMKRGTPEDLKSASNYIAIYNKSDTSTNSSVFNMLSYVLRFIAGDNEYSRLLTGSKSWSLDSPSLIYFFQILSHYWVDKSSISTNKSGLKKMLKSLNSTGQHWMISEVSELLSCADDKEASKFSRQASALREKYGFISIVDIVKQKESWERALDAISQIGEDTNLATKKEAAVKKSRLIWLVEISEYGIYGLFPKEQKLNANGKWSSGRKVSLKRLASDQESFDCLTDHDIKALGAIYMDRSYWGVEYNIDMEQLLVKLVDHPLLFINDKRFTPFKLSKGSPEIRITKQKKKLKISMVPDLSSEGISLVKESETHWTVVESTSEQRHLSSLIGDGLIIPVEAKDKVLASIGQVASIAHIHSDIGGNLSSAENIEADSTLHILLSPLEEGLKFEARTRVFGDKGPYYFPGSGSETIIAEVEGRRVQTNRNISLEQANFESVLSVCPELSKQEFFDHAWSVYDPELCLEILLELKDQSLAMVAWPEGEKLKITQSISTSDFQMNIKKENDWFSASGELTLDDGQVLNMKRLIELYRGARGRFLSLADGQYIALSQTFRKRIEELQAIGEEKDNGIIMHPLAAIVLDDMSDEVGNFKSDKAWKSYIARFNEAMALVPEVPSTLQADLRDYQKEGFQWLARLAHWGVGACLADDMGLGKTVQSIALLLQRASLGPALVVAPTSVAMNWMDEINQFSPTLNIIDYRESKRDKVLKDLAAFDVVICSYGLLQNNIQQIAEASIWTTIILDEAQAIKNSATKRSKAVMSINAEFKLILTGTPIENHLGELWNLFRFINPGLLGSADKFNSRFINPIVKDDAVDVRHKLKTLIHPYILRRTKTQVLKELPSRTEIVLQVEMSKDETALYEALRSEAVVKLDQEEGSQGKGHRQLDILAEITRLRRVCCNPALVLKTAAPASSKLALFESVVKELLENNHKALVFSQFVDHLTLLKGKLEEMNVSYQYLDGKTPAKERKKRVTAFQSGEGDVFLISLKAGGVGLNLTAADYVIHMDPWWNPAVEDQASDRAHRIGQKRPVTVYRMITKNTIEEKIVALHQGKRDLADNLLAGSDIVGKVNMEELLSLLKEH